MNRPFQSSVGDNEPGALANRTLIASESNDIESCNASQPSNGNEVLDSDSVQRDAPPEFGLLDVVEAFTALRHELRTQTRENRELSTSIQEAAQRLIQMETKLDDPDALDESQNVQGELHKIIEAIVEFDIHLNRTVDALVNSKRASSLSEIVVKSIQAEFENRGFISRRFCRRFFQSVLGIVTSHLQETSEDSTNEGLTMVVSRIGRIMRDCDIERFETVGQPFDASTMHAIAAVESDQQPSGYVDEQISPSYFWRGELFRCADVRVAK